MAQSKKHSPLAKYNKEIPVFACIFQRLLKGIQYATHSSTAYIPLLLSFSSHHRPLTGSSACPHSSLPVLARALVSLLTASLPVFSLPSKP